MTPDPQLHADALAEHLLVISAGAATLATDDLRNDVKRLVSALVARWELDFGSLEVFPVDSAAVAPFLVYARSLVARLKLGPAAEVALIAAADDGYRAGLDHADKFTGVPGPNPALRPSRELPDLAAVVHQHRVTALTRLDERVLEADGFASVLSATATLDRATSRIVAIVGSEVTLAASEAVRDVAARAGMRVVWVAERGACLHCLAYSGRTTIGAFPPDLTFDERPLRQNQPVLGPPLHPQCRCALQPLAWSDDAFAEDVQREARRSVLRGWSEQESRASRLRAAARLLHVGADLPPTVEARARRAVRNGRFN
jgi:hypothetical protein